MILKKKEFKAESKRLLDLMIHSIYTNKDIFLRELISNASDALDKLYYKSLTDSKISIQKDDLKIYLEVDKKKRTITISDNGCGMTEDELENNLGTIAKSGSYAFKQENIEQDDVNIIGQFGVGFYSAFMVSDKVEVLSKTFDGTDAYLWSSNGVDGYTISKKEKDTFGTKIILYIKEDTEEYKYSDYLEEYKIRSIIKRYSDYVHYPIIMNCENRKLKDGSKDEYEMVHEDQTLNSMVPIWKKNKKDITKDEYNNFYSDKFFDYEEPMKEIHFSVEGQCSYTALLYIPSHAPYDFYSKEYEKGLQLYSNNVLIMDKCKELLPDYFNFVKGVVDSPDLSLNISREILQQDKTVGLIAKNIEKKIKNELLTMLEKDRESYKKFFKSFGLQLKFGIYNDYGLHKDTLQDLLLFYSSKAKDLVTLKEVVNNMNKEQNTIYYACGETTDKIDLLPQVETIKEKGYPILYLTEYVDEFVMKTLMEYDIQAFVRDIQPRSIHKIKLKQQILEDIARDKQSNIVAPLFRGTHRLALLNQQGEEIRQLGSYPETKADFTDVEKREMFQFSYTVTPDRRIILCYNWTDLIEIYSSEGILLHRLHGPDQFISPFQEIHKEKVIIARPQKGEQREGYYNPVIVGDTFFVLYNGNKVDSENYDENSRQLFIFDWNGKPLKRLLLDQGILTFTVDSINKKIYGISSSPEFHIVSFDFDL